MFNTTLFQQRVYNAVRLIPRGKVSTYKAVARTIGRPNSSRAVGNALNKNRDSSVPCHRVIRSDGFIGGYNRGLKEKIIKLKLEGIKIKNQRIDNRQRLWYFIKTL